MKKEILILVLILFMVGSLMADESSSPSSPGGGGGNVPSNSSPGGGGGTSNSWNQKIDESFIIKTKIKESNNNCAYIFAENNKNNISLAICWSFTGDAANISMDYPFSPLTKANFNIVILNYKNKTFSILDYDNMGYLFYKGGNIDTVLNGSISYIPIALFDSEHKSACFVKVYVDLNDYGQSNLGTVKINGILFEDDKLNINDIEQNLSSQSQRLSVLESWKITINNTLSTLQTSITNILSTLTNHETRISKLENQTISNNTIIINNITYTNSTFPNYFKYLSSSDRRGMACGYAQENHLTTITDLGWVCNITYRQTSRGETSSCKCKGK